MKLERTRERLSRDARDQSAYPRGLDLSRLDPGIFECFVRRFDYQIFLALIPVLSEFGASHSDDRHPVGEVFHALSPRRLYLRNRSARFYHWSLVYQAMPTRGCFGDQPAKRVTAYSHG